MKKNYSKIFPLLCFLLLLTQLSTVPESHAAKIKLSKKKLTLTVGDTCRLKLKGTSKKAKWTSSKKKIATVSAAGKVKAKKKGKTTITAKLSGKTYTCQVTVKKASAPELPAAPDETSAPVTPINAEEDPSDTAATSTEDTSSEPSVKNLSITARKLYSHVLLTITNQNDCWLSAVEVNYDFYDKDDEFLSYGAGSLLSMMPGETQYIALDPLLETTSDINLVHSELTVNIEKGNPLSVYDSTTAITHTIEKDTETDYTLSLTNPTDSYVEGSYIIFFYDQKKNLLDAYQNTFSINAEDYIEEYFTEPSYYDEEYNLITPVSSYDFQYTAHTVSDIT